MTPVALTDEQLEQLANLVADRVIDHLADTTTTGGLVDAAEVAHRYGVTRSWVYEHADRLGAIRLHTGNPEGRPRLRFNPATVEAALQHRGAEVGGNLPPTCPPRRPRARQRPGTTPNGAPLLPYHPMEAA